MTVKALAALVMPITIPLIPVGGLVVSGVKFIIGFFSKELSIPESPSKKID
jgi:NADH:ubiquinone oxidoreductase subunit 5 (subunit L)/multisubunit Na+/H+ antiporter MnhA subunit